MDRTYSLATNDFMAVGGDEYVMFAENPITGHYQALDEALIAYLEGKEAVEVATEGRIVATAEDSKEQEPKQEEQKPVQEQKPEQVVSQDLIYIVKPGDNLYRIGINHDVHWRTLAEYNKLSNPALIHPNQKILIPAQ